MGEASYFCRAEPTATAAFRPLPPIGRGKT